MGVCEQPTATDGLDVVTLSTPSSIVAEETRAAMARRRMSQSALGRVTGRDRTYYTRRLTGDVPFTIDEIVELAALLGVTTRTLLGDLVKDPVPA